MHPEVQALNLDQHGGIFTGALGGDERVEGKE